MGLQGCMVTDCFCVCVSLHGFGLFSGPPLSFLSSFSSPSPPSPKLLLCSFSPTQGAAGGRTASALQGAHQSPLSAVGCVFLTLRLYSMHNIYVNPLTPSCHRLLQLLFVLCLFFFFFLFSFMTSLSTLTISVIIPLPRLFFVTSLLVLSKTHT